VHADVGIPLPPSAKMLDWEAELVAVIGRTAKNAPVESTLDYVPGYTVANDLSMRDFMRGRTRRKVRRSGTTGLVRNVSMALVPWVPGSFLRKKSLTRKAWVVRGESRSNGQVYVP
jgi:2-keto-4-pentenoate hydratase/2-oxohepta-3-ene-1,7-dioic acid hydratase in catechol pathway